MPTPFAALEARLNASAIKRMANARVSLGGADVDVVFDNPSAVSGGGLGMQTTAPTLEMLTAQVPADWEGKTFVHNGTTWAMVEHEPDGTGWSVLVLERRS